MHTNYTLWVCADILQSHTRVSNLMLKFGKVLNFILNLGKVLNLFAQFRQGAKIMHINKTMC